MLDPWSGSYDATFPGGQNTYNRSCIVANSVKTEKMVHIKKRKRSYKFDARTASLKNAATVPIYWPIKKAERCGGGEHS